MQHLLVNHVGPIYPAQSISNFISPHGFTNNSASIGLNLGLYGLTGYMAHANYVPAQSSHSPVQYQSTFSPGQASSSSVPGQKTILSHAFSAMTPQDPTLGAWNMDTGASSHLNNSVTSLSEIFNTCMYPSILVGDGHSIPVTNTGHSILPTPTKSLHLNNILITPHIVKNLIFVRQFVRDNNCTIEFNAFSFSVKDFLTRRVLLRCDSTGIFTQSQLHLLSLMFSLLVSIRGTSVLDIQDVKCYVTLFLIISFRVIRKNLLCFVMLVSLANT
ncbi:hypothetical protein Tco_0431125 [Tanacetum coccineum]